MSDDKPSTSAGEGDNSPTARNEEVSAKTIFRAENREFSELDHL